MLNKVLVVAFVVTAIFAGADNVSANGDGSSAACTGNAVSVMGSQGGEDNGGSANLATVNVGAGNVVTGVCIKSGNNMFNGTKHSGVLANGTYENGCYTVSGVGTQTVTVTRILSGNTCQGISHIDVVYTKASTETKVANITATAKCVTVRDQAMIEVTLTNSGNANGSATVNGEIVNVAAGENVVKHYPANTKVTVVFNGNTVYEDTLECKPGQGENPTPTPTPTPTETPTPSQSTQVVEVAELPNTAGSNAGPSTNVLAVGAVSIISLILAAGYVVKSRLLNS